jgi:RNA polymerase sigma-70 factor (ECF subfamily)
MVLHPVVPEEKELVARLRSGDEDAFGQILTAWSPAMLRVAQAPGGVSTSQLVQEAWLAVMRRLDRHEEPQSLRVWVFGILVDLVRRRTGMKVRVDENNHQFLDPVRFRGPDDQWPGGWTPDGVPEEWSSPPADHDLDYVTAALDRLPAGPRMVVTLRDVCGFTADEASEILRLSNADQRQLLHQGRSRIRAALEERYRESMGVARS